MRIYALEEGTEHKLLIALECDHCGARIRPHSGIASSGWVKQGLYYGPKDPRNTQYHYCPQCADQFRYA